LFTTGTVSFLFVLSFFATFRQQQHQQTTAGSRDRQMYSSLSRLATIGPQDDEAAIPPLCLLVGPRTHVDVRLYSILLD
jgi:hypothetical protein